MFDGRGIFHSTLLDESANLLRHDSGLRILLLPKSGAAENFAGMITQYGSVDTRFQLTGDPDFTDVADGTAHFLEHKLFESEQGDAFTLFSQTGASANAFTSFDKTCYYFTAAQNFYAALEILLGFVTRPYFTAETVAKEQGIIGQEIKMYDDQPGWRVLFNLLESLYHVNPVRRDIGGTVESIATLTPERLMRAYSVFYNLNNMILVVSGDFEKEKVLALCDKTLAVSPQQNIERLIPDEPAGIVRARVEQKLAVGLPLFMLGYKQKVQPAEREADDIAAGEMLLELVAGKGSRLYRELYDEGLITAGFETEYFCGRGFCAALLSGESRDPDETGRRIRAAVADLHRTGVSEEDFLRVRRKLCGRTLKSCNDREQMGLIAAESVFCGREPFGYAEAYFHLTRERLCEALAEGFDDSRCCLSAITAN